jgi:benzylsuccinate CoA-transferase BbsF subunit
LPLKGVRVLSFEVAYSLPAGTRTLAELGAEVVRVAGPGRDSFYIGVVDGVYLLKPCIGINLKDPAGLELARQLVRKADVVCSNFVSGVMGRLALDYEALSALNPSLIALELSGYGAPGPWAGYPAFGPSTEAAGGMNALVGPEDGPPVRIGSGVWADQLGGRYAALALIAALEERQRTGKGRFIDFSMAEGISLLLGHTVLEAALGQPAPARLGNRDRDFAPQGVYPCLGEDEWVALTVQTERQWGALVRFLAAAGVGQAAELSRKELATAAGRRAHLDAIDAVITAWTSQRAKDEAAEAIQKLGIPASPVQANRDPLFDPHLRERGLFRWVNHDRPILGYTAHPHPTTPWFADAHARPELTQMRYHGADNVTVLHSWLGMSEEEVHSLEDAGALIAPFEVEVEDRRTTYRDDDFADQLSLPGTDTTAPPAAPPRPRAQRSRESQDPYPGGEGRPLRILDLSRGPAAAFAGMILAELGHEVIRLELPGRALEHRPFTAELSDTERQFLDRRKKSVKFADDFFWGNPFRALAVTVDAIVEDLGFGGMSSLGLRAHEARRDRPNVIVASISPYGTSGPKSRWEASELTIQASSGPLHSTGWLGDTPQKAAGFPAHHIAGLNATTAILARAYGIHAGNCSGGRIEISMQECYLHHWTRHIGEWTYSGTKMRRERPGFGHQGFRHTAMAADGYLYSLALFASWDEIALFWGLEDFLGEPWSSADYRQEHWPEIEPTYLKNLASRSRYDWFADASAAGYTFAPVHSAADQLTNVQFAARGFLRPAEIDGREVPCPGLPFAWDEPAMPNRPPRPGEHTQELLGGQP